MPTNQPAEVSQVGIGNENVLIAEFMGAQINEKRKFLYFPLPVNKAWDFVDLQYHTSWDWLMPVVEKIEQLYIGEYVAFMVEIKNQSCCIYCHYKDQQDGVIYRTPYLSRRENKIEAVYLAIIAFIKWYNTQSK
jgi:hypothetical protein